MADWTGQACDALEQTARITFATALNRAAYSGDLELVQLLLSYGADPNQVSTANETALMAASGHAWIDGYSNGKSYAERLEVVKLLVESGGDVNAALLNSQHEEVTPQSRA